MKSPNLETVLTFIEKINLHDAVGIAALLTEDHLFIDALGFKMQGREKMQSAWAEYFRMMPDYEISCEDIFEDRDRFGIFGVARGTYSREGHLLPENRWEIPAAWRAVVKNNLIAEWQVYCDNEPVRQKIQR
jgi:ketosteroid isomerase-like protein